MNVVEQLVYFGKLEGMPANLAKRHALQWLEKLEMTPHLKKKTEELSKEINKNPIDFSDIA